MFLSRPGLILGVMFVFTNLRILAQDCEVRVDALKGKYDGGCEDGKAEGRGKATGTDSYDGEFKSGLPNGTGTYVWANGNVYDGHWLKGKRDGKGVMHYKTATGDSMLNGYWKRDEYAGLYENPYEIIYKGTAKVEVRFLKNDNRNEINMTVSQVQNRLAPVTQPVLNYTNIITGYYTDMVPYSEANKNVYSFKEVRFPFHAKFMFNQREVEIQFFNTGSYEVEVVYYD